MGEKFYLSLLISFAAFSQYIWAFEETTNLHRQKRLIDISDNESKAVTIEQVPYVVHIIRNGELICGGSIMSPSLVLTAAHCFLLHPLIHKKFASVELVYEVCSGSEERFGSTKHSILRKEIHKYFHPPFFVNDIALIEVDPPIDLEHSPNRKISLHLEEIAPNTLGTISGWGCIQTKPKIKYPDTLQSIEIPIISLQDCKTAYTKIRPIREENICAHDSTKQKSSCGADSGNPLVVNGKLVGVLSGSFGQEMAVYPEVFVRLAHPSNRVWIRLASEILGAPLCFES